MARLKHSELQALSEALLELYAPCPGSNFSERFLTNLRPNGEIHYIGHFDDGSTDIIRKSFNSYANCYQLRRDSLGPQGEFLFSRKRRSLTKHEITQVPIHLTLS